MDGASSVPPMNGPQDGEMMPSVEAPQGDDAMQPMDGPQDAAMESPMDAPEGENADGTMDMPQDADGDEDDSTMSIINKLSPVDKEAVRSYAESMLSRDENLDGEGDDSGMEEPMDGGAEGFNPQGGPMMETFIFKKSQIKKINENFGPSQDAIEKDNNREPLPKKNNSKISKKSPFNSPKFK